MAKNNIDWSPVGFFKRPKSIRMFYDAAVNLKKRWKSSTTGIYNNTFDRIEKVVFPLIDTSNVTSMAGAFSNRLSDNPTDSFLVYLPQLNTSNVTNMREMFILCRGLKSVPQLDTSKVTNMKSMFNGCNSLTKTFIMNITSCTDMSWMFADCTSLTEIWFKGQPKSTINLESFFSSSTHAIGTFYYDSRYDYSAIIAVLPSTWASVAWNYETNQPA